MTKMEEYASARSKRVSEWEKLQTAYEKASRTLEDEWDKVLQGHKELQGKKDDLAKQNGGANVDDSDVLDINAGGQIIRVSRGTLTQIEGSRLGALFSGRWEKRLQRDSKGRMFLDVNPLCFKAIVDYLNECKIAPPDSPPDLPRVDDENQVFLKGLLTAFGLYNTPPVDSEILKDQSHVYALTGFLEEDNHGCFLSLLYRGTRDGMDATTFHAKCDNQGPTVAVVRSSEGYIFGGFADVSWKRTGDWRYSKRAFLFGLHCHGGKEPVKIQISNVSKAFFHHSDYGPTFGGGHDLSTIGNPNPTNLGHSYQLPPSGNNHYFTGTRGYTLTELEVFKVDEGPHSHGGSVSGGTLVQAQSFPLDGFPKDLRLSFQAEEQALAEATNELVQLQEAFAKEQAAVNAFSQNADEIVLLNVSGQQMAVKQSTLAKYPDSVLYKQFADPNWNGKSHTVSPSEWNAKQVAEWSCTIHGLSDDISGFLEGVNGAELLALEREDVKDLGIKRPGMVALVVKAIQKLRDEEDEKSVAFVEHSEYCFSKIIDLMRLKAMADMDVPDPNPPKIREPDRKRFKRIVEYYFPTAESAAHFLA